WPKTPQFSENRGQTVALGAWTRQAGQKLSNGCLLDIGIWLLSEVWGLETGGFVTLCRCQDHQARYQSPKPRQREYSHSRQRPVYCLPDFSQARHRIVRILQP